jgi:hypothetical protein
MTETGLGLPVDGRKPAVIGQSPGIWLVRIAALLAILLLAILFTDSKSKFGWDVRVNCAAVDAHVEGLDPYFVKNLKGTKLSYPYLPVTLDIFRPLCSAGFLVDHYRGVYLVLAVLCSLLLPGLGATRSSLRDVSLRALCVLGAFGGFDCALASGNFVIFSGLLTAVALALLLGGSSEGEDGRGFLLRLTGAAVLGLLTSFKLVFFPVLASLYFLPLPRHRKLVLIAVAAGMFILPILVSMMLYADLFASWLSAISGQIPGQHTITLDEVNPSLLILAFDLAGYAGLAGSKPIVFVAYGLAAVALVLVPFALSASRAVGDEGSSDAGWPLKRLDRWLMDHPREATRITVLAMYALYLCSPRLKEYAFFELAIYAAVLIVDLSSAALAVAVTVAVLIPTLALSFGSEIESSFIQLMAALACFWILLFDFRTRRLRDQGDVPFRTAR